MKVCIVKFGREVIDGGDWSETSLISAIDHGDWQEVSEEDYIRLRNWCCQHNDYTKKVGYCVLVLENDPLPKIEEIIKIEKTRERDLELYRKKEEDRRKKVNASKEAKKLEKARKLLQEAGEL